MIKKYTAQAVAWIIMTPLFVLLPVMILADYLREAEWPMKIIDTSERVARWGTR